ncbi:MAG TPA: rhomboid family intramembrane serine protease [Planctomycetota bacterium]|nr:rhomboid family intramembrane serine protease [Planctomycetota bacterium]
MRPYYNHDDDRGGLGGMRISFRFGWTRTVKVLIIVTALAYLVELMLLNRFPDLLEWVGFYRPNFLRGAVWQVVSYMFVHDPGSLWHLLLNMLGLFFFAGDVERALGRGNFLTMYLLCGVAGGLLSLYQGDVPVVGASGGVLGVMVAFAVLFPDARIILFPIPLPVRARYVAIFFCFVTVASLLMDRGGAVAHWAHLGGIAVGFLFVKARPLREALRHAWRSRRRLTRERRSAAEQAELDRILEKVHRDGITTLSNRERDFLNAMSRKYRDDD